jgi:hypothetical protein
VRRCERLPFIDALMPCSLPEIEALLCCARLHGGRTSPDVLVPPDPARLDWDHLHALSTWHRMRPHLHRGLAALYGAAVPAWHSERLTEEAYQIAQWNVYRTGELLRLAVELEAEGIPALLAKGPVLAHKAYGDVAMREFLDLDLVVRERDRRAAEALLSRRYRRCRTKLRADRHRAEDYETVFRHESGAAVELHWRLHVPREGFAIDYDRLFSGAVRTTLFGREILDLSPEEWIVQLSIHGARHRYHRLHWLVDLAALITSHTGIDWLRVEALATEARARRCVYLTLFLLEELLRMPVPTPLAAQSRRQLAVRRMAGGVARRLCQGECRGFGDFGEAYYWGMELQDRPFDRARYAAWIGGRGLRWMREQVAPTSLLEARG